jgi:DNA-binding SARP family transcriptional activator
MKGRRVTDRVITLTNRVEIAIQLLGPPQVTLGGSLAEAPRGRKVWALLGYLLRSEGRPRREAVAGLLFPEADDPLGALRSTLFQIRRLLDSRHAVGGDPIELLLPEGALVDVDVLLRGARHDAVSLPRLGRPFLEGVNPAAGATFELWLENERRHIAGATEGVIHEAALATLAHGDTSTALDLASRLVELNPLDENAQVLYVRCLATAGHVERARRQVESCTNLFRRDLGVDPSPALREAAEARPPQIRSRGRAAVLAQLEAGEAAFAAGAVNAGLGILQQAVVDAGGDASADLLARALVTLGSALVHAARGSDEEGAAVLHRAIEAAEASGDARLAATAHRELGYVELLRGQYARADAWLIRAAELADPDSEERAWILAVHGASQTDTGDHAGARDRLSEGADLAHAAPATRAEAWVRSFLGRLALLREELGVARNELQRSIAIAQTDTWNAFLPWPEALLAEVDLKQGHIDQASVSFEHAFAMGCQLGDPCWESVAARGLGLVAASSGELERAVELLQDAPRRCRRLPDSYRWIEAYAMAALGELAVDAGLEAAPSWVTQLETLASRHGMRELVATAATLRARLGEPQALETATLVAQAVDNPALHRRLSAQRPGQLQR